MPTLNTTLIIRKRLLAANERAAAAVREELAQREILALNLLGGPGAGKTSLLERMAVVLGPRLAVLAGDVETERDAARVGRHGVQSVAITTAGSCHLDALMVQRAIHALDLDVVRLLVIENVGNLVCPAAFDLGEAFKAVMLSVPEGDDKPLKYPAIFARAEVALINKIDLLPHCPDFEPERARRHALAVNPRLTFFELSCRSGEGIEPWLRLVEARL